jgi:hypothetical protein
MLRKRIVHLCVIVIFGGYFIAETPIARGAETESDTAKPASTLTDIQTLNHLELLSRLLFSFSSRGQAQTTLNQIAESGDTRFVTGLIDMLRYHRPLAPEIGRTLNQLTGQNLPSDWGAWVEWAGKHPELRSFADYPTWKAGIFEKIDPNFRRFVSVDMKIAPGSRVEEIVWGGVHVDGIPALDNPKMVDPSEADYLIPDERVFGVSINGDTRAYPARFLDWHEMLNDVIGGEPVSLAY